MKQQIHQLHIIGIAIRTTNENNQAANDIPCLWKKFTEEKIIEKIPDKIDSTVYCIYTDYEKDHTKPYTTILGCAVKSLSNIPEGMVGKTIHPATYEIFIAKGNLMEGAVFNEWVKIWEAGLPRTFTADFEVYGKKAQNFNDAEVELFIAVNPGIG